MPCRMGGLKVTNTRRTWFITRPTRDALSAHAELALAMRQTAQGQVWRGNRHLHQRLENALGKLGVKKDAVSKDGSGGRTWAALARTFGYWYPDHQGRVVITPVGKAIADGIRVHEHIQKQILCYQLPNGYVLSADYRPKFADGFELFPFRFLLRLLLAPGLEGRLSRDEIALYVITARTDDDLDLVQRQIESARFVQQRDGVPLAERTDEVQRIASQFDHRQRSDAQGPYLDYARDSALTHMILLEALNARWFRRSEGTIALRPEYAGEAGELLNWYEVRYPFSRRYKVDEQFFAAHYGLDLSRSKAVVHYGRPIASKVAKRKQRVLRVATDLQARGVIKAKELVEHVREQTGFEPAFVQEVLEQEGLVPDLSTGHLPDVTVERYLTSGRDSARWAEFEDLTRAILNIPEGLHAWKPPSASAQTSIEIALCIETRSGVVGAILDCKSGQSFRLTPNLRDLMATTYLSQYAVLRCPQHGKVTTKYFGYVVGHEFLGEKHLRAIPHKASLLNPTQGVSGAALNARTLLYLIELLNTGTVDIDAFTSVLGSLGVFLHPYQLEAYLRSVSRMSK